MTNGHASASSRVRRLAGLALSAWLLIGCGDSTSSTHPFVVIGVDGAEWAAIERLWERGELQNLRRLAEAGARTALATRYGSSPAIWNTVATGMDRDRHGITGFVKSTPSGDRPVVATMRQVPAIWEMAGTTGRRVAVLGWWASWPASRVNGVLVTDRLLRTSNDRVWPPERAPWLTAGIRDALNGPRRFPDFELERTPLRQDEIVAHLATDLAGQGFDLLMLYLRAPDVVSHHKWKYFRPDAQIYESVDPDRLQRYRDHVPAAYQAVDSVIGQLLRVAPETTNFVVLSDHGFRARRERLRIMSDADPLLEHLGFLVRDETGAIDFGATQLYTYASPAHQAGKKLRFPTSGREPGGTVTEDQQGKIVRELRDDLQNVRYGSGKPVFRLRDPTARERDKGSDIVLQVLTEGADTKVSVAGDPLDGVIHSVSRLTGGHRWDEKGIFVAAGPDIDSDAELDGMSIFDITPTLLYGLGLPVAADFDGRAWTGLFTPELRAAQPLQTIPSWGRRDATGSIATDADEEIIQDLRALGYLD